MNILLIGETHPLIADELRRLQIRVIKNPEISDSTVTGIVVRGGYPIDKACLDRFPHLKLIISAGIGVDNIDVSEAQTRGIMVAYCPYASTISVAEHSVALFTAATHHLVKANNALKAGVWDRSSVIGHEWYGKSAGIVGFGRIGRYVGQLLVALGLTVYGYDISVPEYHFARSKVIKCISLRELCKKTQYLFVHLPKDSTTLGLVDKSFLKLLRRPNGIINTSRGGIVNEADIKALLQRGELGFYATDVFASEPQPDADLLKLSSVIVSPHIGANTHEAQERIARDVVFQIQEYFIEHHIPSYLVSSTHL